MTAKMEAAKPSDLTTSWPTAPTLSSEESCLPTLRKRGNTYLRHLWDGQPPVLAFPCELVLDGRTLARPVNYSLVRILNRETEKPFAFEPPAGPA